MNVQNIMEIATKEVLTISEDETIKSAIDSMYKNNHRDIVVISKEDKRFGLLRATDLISINKQGLSFDQKISSISYPCIETLHTDETVLDAINCIAYQNQPLCVVDDDGALAGFVSYYDLLSSIDPNMMLERRYIAEILIGSELKKASQDTALVDVVEMMDNAMYDCVILIDDNHKAVGIITTKDIVRFFNKQVDMNEKASKYMVSPLLTVSYNTSIKDSLDFIKEKHFKRLIITNEDGEPMGQVTQEELLARVYSRWAESLRNTQSQLEQVNKLLNEKVIKYEVKSVTDRLTGIYNREKFEAELNNEIERVKRYKVDYFSIIFFDIDNFKKINDACGHLAGDRVLKAIAMTCKEQLRTTDIYARWGGEEFAVIMPHTNLENAVKTAQKLRQTIAENPIQGIGEVTCSFGVSEFSEFDDAQSILTEVDSAMYKAKKSGKNRVAF